MRGSHAGEDVSKDEQTSVIGKWGSCRESNGR